MFFHCSNYLFKYMIIDLNHLVKNEIFEEYRQFAVNYLVQPSLINLRNFEAQALLSLFSMELQ